MKSMKLIANAACALFVGILAASCNNNDTPDGPNKGDMKRVEFKTLKDVVESETPTGNIQGDKREYLQVVRKQQTLDPAELIQSRVEIFPGSVLRGGALLNDEYTPLVLKEPKEITLSMTLQGKGLKVQTTTLPIMSQVRQKVNDLVNENKENIDYENVPTYLTYISHEVDTEESFNKTFRTHLKVNVLAGLIKANFNYSWNKNTSYNKKYVLVKVRQLFYSINVDPVTAEDWGTFVKPGEYEPVYVSSVDYGRVANLLIQTEESAEEVKRMINASISFALKKFGGEAGASYEKEMKRLFKEKKVQIMIAGGPLSMGKDITTYEEFINFLKKPTAFNLVQSAAPIGYTLRSAIDGRKIEIKTTYTESNKIFK